MLRLALPLALTGLCQQAYFYADNLFVRALCGPAELGRYNACVRVFSWLVFFAAFATTAALPWLARRHESGELGSACARLAQPLFLGACALAGALWPWSGELLRFVYGADFEAAAGSLRWLLAAALAVYAGAAFFTAVIAAGRTRAALAIAALALGVNVLANAFLVPRYAAEGAAAVTLATEATVALASLATLVALGARPGARPLAWLGGPALFALAFVASRTLLAPVLGS
jgi:O-antigen/teichoic acid export membrane protein